MAGIGKLAGIFKMTNRLKYLGLSLGLLMVFLSFLFFDTRPDDYLIMLLTGLLFSSFFYLTILFGQHAKKTKFSWTIAILILALLQWQTEDFLIDCSYKIFISDGSFDAHSPGVIGMLRDKPAGIVTSKDTTIDPTKTLSNNDKFILYYKLSKLDHIRVVTKENNYIYFGFADTRHGIVYWTDKSKPDPHYRHLFDNWYR
jgi:hypothetical protein